MFPNLISSLTAGFSRFTGPKLDRDAAKNEQEVSLGRDTAFQGKHDLIVLERLLPDNLFPRIKIENIGLLVHREQFSISDEKIRLQERCQEVPAEDFDKRLKQKLSELPSGDFANRLSELVKIFSKLHKEKTLSGLDKKLDACYQQTTRLKHEMQEFLFEKLARDDFPAKQQLAKKLASVFPANELSISNIRKLLEYTSAPLSATYGGAFDSTIPVRYDRGIVEITLGAENFNPLAKEFAGLAKPESERALFMITSRDSYTKEALELLIYDSSRKVRPEVLAAILVRNPKLIEDHKLENLFTENLPFSSEQNSALLERALNRSRSAKLEMLVEQVYLGNTILTNPEYAGSLFKLEDSDKARQIALLSKLYNKKIDKIERSENGRWFI